MTGRPSRINDVVRTTAEGREVTVRDVIVDAIAAGNYVETAAALAGVHKDSIYEWLKVGARLASDLHKGRRTPSDASAHEKDCQAFSDAIAEAQARSEARDVAQLAELGRGGRVIESSSVKRDARGVVIESTSKTETAEPNPAVLMWRLERRFPDRWGRRRLELSGPDGGPVEVDLDPRDRLLGLLGAIRDRQATTDEVLEQLDAPPPPPEGSDDDPVVP